MKIYRITISVIYAGFFFWLVYRDPLIPIWLLPVSVWALVASLVVPSMIADRRKEIRNEVWDEVDRVLRTVDSGDDAATYKIGKALTAAKRKLENQK